MAERSDAVFPDLDRAMAEVLRELLEHGFALPLYATVVSRNGCIISFVYAPSGGGLHAEVVAGHEPEPGMRLPINIFFSDSRGEAARVVIREDSSRVIQLLN